ncbi:uncharacterized protein BJ171DRAFT_507844 [Polychytrium aggregatum]|uniref:uncharacterized protein n=1 Tax=Polychytrium aggregatum TaxID=110093 RepID=UPI0022FEB4C7|nr:uncharacterized protein BJ171DRAFT_507844 [Polychytrium aggregatum]KAI9203749.1 hypothetical protein BJ171DRAFT_507844 [Polychytrium aggregatum]
MSLDITAPKNPIYHFELEFEKHEVVPGDVITGNIIIDSHHDLNAVNDIVIAFEGVQYHIQPPNAAQTGSKGSHQRKIGLFGIKNHAHDDDPSNLNHHPSFPHEIVSSSVTKVWTIPAEDGGIIKPGHHTFPFTINVPSTLPVTAAAADDKEVKLITYRIRAIIERAPRAILGNIDAAAHVAVVPN